MLHVNLDDIYYALLLMALGMLGVIVVLLIMVLVMYLMKFVLGEEAPVKHKTKYLDPENLHSDVDHIIKPTIGQQPIIKEVAKSLDIKIDNSKINTGRPPIEVITAAVAMYLSVEQEARSKTNV